MADRATTVREAHRASLKKLYAIIQLLIEYHFDLAMIQEAGDQIEKEYQENLKPPDTNE